jgi:hypothetical protein
MNGTDVVRRSHRTAMLAVAAVFALGGSGYAAAAGVNSHSPGRPSTTPPPQGHGNGVVCQGTSKQHAPGEKGTPFSNCVTALANGR